MYCKKEIDIVARTIYGEARGEYLKHNGGISSLIAIANVILNRSIQSSSSPATICQKPFQFSCWNKTDINRKIIQNVDETNYIFGKCKDIAERALNGKLPDITCGADHYYSKTAREPPYWTKKMQKTCEIGSHIFFKGDYK